MLENGQQRTIGLLAKVFNIFLSSFFIFLTGSIFFHLANKPDDQSKKMLTQKLVKYYLKMSNRKGSSN